MDSRSPRFRAAFGSLFLDTLILVPTVRVTLLREDVH